MSQVQVREGFKDNFNLAAKCLIPPKILVNKMLTPHSFLEFGVVVVFAAPPKQIYCA